MTGDAANRLCLKLSIDPSTPLHSFVESTVTRGVSRPLEVRGDASIESIVRKCKLSGCRVIAVIDDDGRLVKALDFNIVAAALAAGSASRLSDLSEHEVPVLGSEEPVYRLIEVLLLHGPPVLVVDQIGRPLYAIDSQAASSLVEEEIDVEELRGAD